MDIIGITKTAAGVVASGSVGMVIGNVIKNNIPENAKLLSKVGMSIGGFVLGGIAGDFAARYVENQIDEGIEVVKSMRHTKIVVVEEKDQPENDEAE